LGEDARLDRVEALSSRALVGRFEYIVPSRGEVIKWVNNEWNSYLGYCAGFITFMKGWVCFQFMKDNDLHKVLDRFWMLGKGSLVLKKWKVDFNPLYESLLKESFVDVTPWDSSSSLVQRFFGGYCQHGWEIYFCG
jgi:hypothetical protein